MGKRQVARAWIAMIEGTDAVSNLTDTRSGVFGEVRTVGRRKQPARWGWEVVGWVMEAGKLTKLALAPVDA